MTIPVLPLTSPDGRSRSVSRLVSRFEQLDRKQPEPVPAPARPRNPTVEPGGGRQEKSQDDAGAPVKPVGSPIDTPNASCVTSFTGSGTDKEELIAGDAIETNKIKDCDKISAPAKLAPSSPDVRSHSVPCDSPLHDSTHSWNLRHCASEYAPSEADTEDTRASDVKIVALGAFCSSPVENPQEIVFSVISRGPGVARDSFEIHRATARTRRPPLTIYTAGSQERISISRLLERRSPDYNKSLPPTPRTPRVVISPGKKYAKRVKFRSRIASYRSPLVPYVPKRSSNVTPEDQDVELLQAVTYNPHGPPIFEYVENSPDASDDWENCEDSGWEDLEEAPPGLATVVEEPSQVSPADSGIGSEKSPAVVNTPSRLPIIPPTGLYPVISDTPSRRPPPTPVSRPDFTPSPFPVPENPPSHHLRVAHDRTGVRRAYDHSVNTNHNNHSAHHLGAPTAEPELRAFAQQHLANPAPTAASQLRNFAQHHTTPAPPLHTPHPSSPPKRAFHGLKASTGKFLTAISHAATAPLLLAGGPPPRAASTRQPGYAVTRSVEVPASRPNTAPNRYNHPPLPECDRRPPTTPPLLRAFPAPPRNDVTSYFATLAAEADRMLAAQAGARAVDAAVRRAAEEEARERRERGVGGAEGRREGEARRRGLRRFWRFGEGREGKGGNDGRRKIRKEDITVYQDDREYREGRAGWGDRGGRGRGYAHTRRVCQ